MQPNPNRETLRDVKCNVENCYFNNQDSNCTAQEIEVSPCAGTGCESTLCATFVDKQACDDCF